MLNYPEKNVHSPLPQNSKWTNLKLSSNRTSIGSMVMTPNSPPIMSVIDSITGIHHDVICIILKLPFATIQVVHLCSFIDHQGKILPVCLQSRRSQALPEPDSRILPSALSSFSILRNALTPALPPSGLEYSSLHFLFKNVTSKSRFTCGGQLEAPNYIREAENKKKRTHFPFKCHHPTTAPVD